jgi:hypothetical protein
LERAVATASQTIEILEDSIAGVQDVLDTAQHVLQVVDTTERNVRRARKGLKRALILLLVVAVVGGVVFALKTRTAEPPEAEFDAQT